MLRSFSRIPVVLQGMIAFLAVLPFWSIAVVGSPIALWQSQQVESWVALAAYWFLPWATCVAVLRASIFSLPLLAMVFLGFLSHSLVKQNFDETWMQYIRFALIGLGVVLSFGLLNRDILYPFLARHPRFWRNHPRFNVNFPATIEESSSGKSFKALVTDVSLSGVGLSVMGAEAKSFPISGSKFKLTTKGADSVEVSLLASRNLGDVLQLGFQADDSAAMERLFAKVPRNTRSQKLNWFWSSTSQRRLVLVLWCLCLGGTAGMPACGVQNVGGNTAVVDLRELVEKEEERLAAVEFHLFSFSNAFRVPGAKLELGPMALPVQGSTGMLWVLADNNSDYLVQIVDAKTNAVIVSHENFTADKAAIDKKVLWNFNFPSPPRAAASITDEGNWLVEYYETKEQNSTNSAINPPGTIRTDSGLAFRIAGARISRRGGPTGFNGQADVHREVVKSLAASFHSYIPNEPYLQIAVELGYIDESQIGLMTYSAMDVSSSYTPYSNSTTGYFGYPSGYDSYGGMDPGGDGLMGDSTDSSMDGYADSSMDGYADSSMDGYADSSADGSTDSNMDGSSDGSADGGGGDGGGDGGGLANNADCCWGTHKGSSCAQPAGNDMSYRYMLENWPVVDTEDVARHCATLSPGGFNRSYVGITARYDIGGGNRVTTPALCPCVRCGEVTVRVNAPQNYSRNSMGWAYPQGGFGTLEVLSGVCSAGCRVPELKDAQHWNVRASDSPGLDPFLLEENDFKVGSAVFRTHCVPLELHCD